MKATITRCWSAISHRHPTVFVRLVYLILGGFFACLTARVLLWEVHGFGELQADHLMTIGALVGAIASGVYFGRMLRAFKLGSALGLGIAFVGATTYCLVGSAGRGDEAAFDKNAAARQINQDRARAQRSRDEAKSRYATALEAETAECAGGAGPKCLSKRQITAERRTDLEVAELLLQKAKPEQRENGKLKRAAQVITLLPYVKATEEAAERGLAIVWPFIPPQVCELLTIVFLHLAFAVPVPRRRRDRPATGTVAHSPTPGPGTVQLSHGTDPPSDRVVPFRRPAKPVATVETDVLAYVAERLNGGAALPSQTAIVERFDLPKQTVSRWMAKWEAAGLISRTRDGRRNVIRKVATRLRLS